MKLTLLEAINDCKKSAKRYAEVDLPDWSNEERQYVDWFRELKELRMDCLKCPTDDQKKDWYMPIDKAIGLCEEAAKMWADLDMMDKATYCRQYAAWLKELEELRADCAHCQEMYGRRAVYEDVQHE